MAFPRKLNELCSPAYIYFIISVISMVIIFIQNIGNSRRYCVGSFACHVPSTILVFIVKALYMCKDGHKSIAWALVLFPFIVFFIIILLASSFIKEEKKNRKRIVEGMSGSGDRKCIRYDPNGMCLTYDGQGQGSSDPQQGSGEPQQGPGAREPYERRN